mgnify:CR=1 FL=1|jgi:hypothetical protein
MKSYQYKGDIDALKQVTKTEGIRGLYRAYGATVMSFGPFSGLYFMFYEYAKGFFIDNNPEAFLNKVHGTSNSNNIGFFESMACGMFAGSLAGTLTNPLDMAKLRLQV